jgi:hypothetical protein
LVILNFYTIFVVNKRKDMNIRQTFLNFTTETYPHGTESELFHLLPNNLETDEFGNLFLQIGENPSTMFTSHLDTASQDKKKVNHIFEGNIIKTDGTSILGADDKAGVTVMLYLIENNIPGLYYFFLGEERGCIGSKKVANKHRENPLPNIMKVISFDRRGTDSVITFQSGSRCCSEVFGESLARTLNEKSRIEKTDNLVFNYHTDPTGVYTDSYQFMSIYPECTNISVGYMNEHTGRETQDILHLEKLCKVAILVDWENLPVERNPQEVDERGYSYYDDIYKPKPINTTKWKEVERKRNVWFLDSDYDNHISLVQVNEHNKVISVDFSDKRIDRESKSILNLLRNLDIETEGIEYNGSELRVKHTKEHGGHIVKIAREEIAEYLEEFDFWKCQDKNYK